MSRVDVFNCNKCLDSECNTDLSLAVSLHGDIQMQTKKSVYGVAGLWILLVPECCASYVACCVSDDSASSLGHGRKAL